MPLRLPLRRRAGPKTEIAFRRRTAPTPQATRLMKVSLGAGIALLAVLGIVFIPTALRYGEVRPPVIYLEATLGDPINVTVTRATVPYALSTYAAQLVLNNGTSNTTIEIDPLRAGGTWANVSFSDVDGDGALSPGDVFSVSFAPNTTYVLRIFHETRGVSAPVGFLRFP